MRVTDRNFLGMLKKTLIYGIIVFLVLGTIYLSVSLIIRMNADRIQQSEILNSEENLVEVERTIILNRVNRLITDLLYISDSLKLTDMSTKDYSDIEQQWKAFSDRKKIYDQIRYIDIDGNEMIRINYSEEGANIIPKEQLQNKKERFYFLDTINLKENQIYISKMDLNMDGDAIQEPINPVIRLATPYYGDGVLKGIIILNYYADDMLQQVKRIATNSKGHIFMLNSNSYWLYNGADRNKEWSFMYEDRLSESFNNQFSEEWKEISKSDVGSLRTSKGLFSYTNILTSNEFAVDYKDYSISLGEGDWYIVSYISPVSIKGKLFFDNFIERIIDILESNIWAFVLLFIIALVVALLMLINKIEKDRVKYFSEYDTMTGVYNRRAGFEKLYKIYKDAPKEGGKVSICFIDINGLKDVNDHLGHEAGDELIQSIVSVIKENIRSNDFISRLGGDEFLIIFNNLDEAEAENIWIRINAAYQKINETENRKYLISASHGIEEFKFSPNEYIDIIINNADEKMYQEKRIVKKDLKIIRS